MHGYSLETADKDLRTSTGFGYRMETRGGRFHGLPGAVANVRPCAS